MSVGPASPAETLAQGGGSAASLPAFVELGKLKIFELWLGIALTWSLLSEDSASSGRTLALLGCALLIEAGTTSAALALDDVTGYRDGVDSSNHADSDRYGVDKPLITGQLSERQALRFGFGAAFIAVLGMLTGLAIATPVPWWLFALTIAVFLIALNYSYGLRLSYRFGGGELVTFVTVAATLMLPYALVTATISGVVVVESALVGFWMLQIAVFSNTQDAPGDRAAGRRTVAASVSPSANRIFIAAVFCASWGLLLASVATGLLAPVYLLLLLIAPLHLRQLFAGLRDRQWLVARRTGFLAFRAAAAVLFIANLLAVRG